MNLFACCGQSVALTVIVGCCTFAVQAQAPPSPAEKAAYRGLHAAAVRGDVAQIKALAAKSGNVDVRDSYRRTPLHGAAYAGEDGAMRALVAAGADPNALENDRYDIVTIAAVANDLGTLDVALAIGCSARKKRRRSVGSGPNRPQ